MSSKKFENMTKSEKQVAIAKEVLNLIYVKRIKATGGVYLECNGIRLKHTTKERCDVCALGALFLAKYNLVDGKWIDYFAYDIQYHLRYLLKDYFTISQLELIEDVFEGKGYWSKWGHRFHDDEDLMIAIFQNIIDHDGTFKMSVEYEIVQGEQMS